ncbi:AfsR/SARP family transcriptional regulator [Actinoplanes sp. CA-142083]|uniref:AfsR/SARP family transcriptional regulator n=1 Tax=Actinoplanes sp. CA-142083 TaxID=3239903 RepID=UPI003D8E8F67
MNPAAARPVRLRLVETFALVVDGAEVPLAEGARRVLAFLALGSGPMIRSYVAYTLWPDTPESRSLGYLRAALWRLRKAGDDLVEESSGRLRAGAGVRVDVREALDLARCILAGGDPGPTGEACRRLSCGDLLADWYEPWLTEPREQLRQLRLHALEELSARELDRGRIPSAIESALAAVAAEPLRESAHRLLIRAHLAEANAAEALRQYEQFRALLFGELGILPSTRIEELLIPIRGGRALRAG